MGVVQAKPIWTPLPHWRNPGPWEAEGGAQKFYQRGQGCTRTKGDWGRPQIPGEEGIGPARRKGGEVRLCGIEGALPEKMSLLKQSRLDLIEE